MTTKKAKNLNLGEKVFDLKKDVVNPKINPERFWFEVVDITVKSLHLSDDGSTIIINKGEKQENFAFHEDVFIERQNAQMLANRMNAEQKESEKKRYDELMQKVLESEELVNFYVDLEKVT